MRLSEAIAELADDMASARLAGDPFVYADAIYWFQRLAGKVREAELEPLPVYRWSTEGKP